MSSVTRFASTSFPSDWYCCRTVCLYSNAAASTLFQVESDGKLGGAFISSTNIDQSIVQRDDTNGTNIDILNTEKLVCDGGVELIIDAPCIHSIHI